MTAGREHLYEIEVKAWVDNESDSVSWGVGGTWPDRETAVRMLLAALTDVLTGFDDSRTFGWTDQDEKDHPKDRRYREGWRWHYGTLSLGPELGAPL